MIGCAVSARRVCAHALIEKSATLKLRPPCGRCLVAVAVCRRCSHVSAMAQGGTYEMGLAVARAKRRSYVHTCTHVYGHLLTFRYSAFTCSRTLCSNLVTGCRLYTDPMPLRECCGIYKDLNLEFVTKNSFCHEFAARKCN